MNNRSEDAPERKLSPEALAKKLEKRRLSRLRIKEKKRDEREGGGADPGADERLKGSEGKGAGRSVSVVATNSETVKNILGIKTAGNDCKVDLTLPFITILIPSTYIYDLYVYLWISSIRRRSVRY